MADHYEWSYPAPAIERLDAAWTALAQAHPEEGDADGR